uniref:Uncharacterized protein n=1 Tax=Aegilops tauschii subsp. strangulata TaxID=200361 RepID=A0A453KL45_AEGTS
MVLSSHHHHLLPLFVAFSPKLGRGAPELKIIASRSPGKFGFGVKYSGFLHLDQCPVHAK